MEDEGEMNDEDEDGEEMVELDEEQIRQYLAYQQHQQMLMAQPMQEGEEEDVYGEEEDIDGEEDQ